MRELPSPTSEIVCEPPLYRNPFVLQYSSAGERTGCGKMEVAISSYGFTQEPTWIVQLSHKISNNYVCHSMQVRRLLHVPVRADPIVITL
jgi:hypothetical protein